MTSTSSGLPMLSSGMSQYLHPDYIQPLPTTLDAKKSPLALLAQTCSAIGKDASPSKSIIPPLEKKDDKGDKLSDDSSTKRPNSHGSKESGRDSKPGFRTFPPKEIPPLVPISIHSSEKTVNNSSSRSESKSSPVSESLSYSSHNPTSSSPPSSSGRPVSRGSVSNSGRRSTSRSSNGKPDSNGSSEHSHQQHHHTSSSHSHHTSRSSPLTSSSSHHPHTSSPSHLKSSSHSHLSSSMHSPASLASSVKHPLTHPSLLGGYPSAAHLAAAGYPHPLSFMGHGLDPTNPAYHSALAAHSSLSSFSAAAAAAQSSAMKAAAAGAGSPTAGLSPYVTYARVRTPSGATTLVPVCRDPLCTNCQLTLQNSHLSATCTAPGCSQCAHEKSLTSLSALGSLGAAASPLFLPPLSSPSSLANNLSTLSSLHSLYPPSALAAAAAHQGLPYICNWVSGSDYCGKRFTSSEELLQHLRSHTSGMDASALSAATAASYSSLGGFPSALAGYPLVSAPLSPNSLRHAYPTSVSPVSSILGASRYHPYKSPLSSVPTSPQAPRSVGGPLGPYLSPYALFGQRLGAVP